ncbi:U32 family peptidase [filamentous cyanobacterium LEGE 07170]|nr:U32 family peptidase [filamentous cyanobacterium LEGE 07170]
MNKPELLAPAKNLERLKVAVTYGADAVYVGGERYGLRARADNFTVGDLQEGATFAHRNGAKLYITLNAFLHDEDFAGFGDYCRVLDEIGVDAAIASDLGVIREIQRHSSLDVHLSTQASCLNAAAARLWQRTGVKRLIVGRELTIAEAGAIHRQTGMEVEMFTHGAMCMAYSGHCTISNFTAGRDSNRGGCIQSCRIPYFLKSDADSTNRAASAEPITFMSSRDLWGIGQVGEFFRQGICSLKIEGRMKSSFYVAIATRVYRRLIDAYATGQGAEALLDWAATELRSLPNRDYFPGSLDAPAGHDSVFHKHYGVNPGTHKYSGMVMETTESDVVLYIMEPLAVGDTLEFVPPQGEPIVWTVKDLYSVLSEQRSRFRQESVVKLPRATLPDQGQALTPFTAIRHAQAAATTNPELSVAS